MIEKLVVSAGLGILQNANFQDLIAQWEQYGLFTYILPFLIIFAFVFGILIKLNMFGDDTRAISAVIALSVGLISLQFGFVSQFFAELFPRFGIAIAVVLVAIILFGLFVGKNTNRLWIVIGITAFGIVLLKAFGNLGWGQEFDIIGNAGLILLIFLVVLVGILARKPSEEHDTSSIMSEILGLKGGGKP